jgi:hypothetical protein
MVRQRIMAAMYRIRHKLLGLGKQPELSGKRLHKRRLHCSLQQQFKQLKQRQLHYNALHPSKWRFLATDQQRKY